MGAQIGGTTWFGHGSPMPDRVAPYTVILRMGGATDTGARSAPMHAFAFKFFDRFWVVGSPRPGPARFPQLFWGRAFESVLVCCQRRAPGGRHYREIPQGALFKVWW